MENIEVVLGAFTATIAGFFGIAKVMLNQASKDREADREERKKLAEAVALMAENSGKQAENSKLVAEATVQYAKEAKDRNGHLGEQTAHTADLVLQGNKLTAKILNRLEKTAVIAAQDRDILVKPTEGK